MMAAQQPAAVDRLVVVDSLPFIMACALPSATPDQLQGMGAQMKAGILASTKEGYEQQTALKRRWHEQDPVRGATVIEVGPRQRLRHHGGGHVRTLDQRPAPTAAQHQDADHRAWRLGRAYAPWGSTEASTKAIFEQQYAGLTGVQIRMSAAGYHFLMWDDNALVVNAVREAVASK